MTIDSPWVDGLTIGDVLARTACQFSDREAVVFPFTGYRTTYEQFSNEVDQTARSLLALGVEPGHHIGIWAANCPEWILIQFAAARVGAVLVNVNPAYRSHELSYVLKQADISSLFLTDRVKSSNFFEILLEVLPGLSNFSPGDLRSSELPALRRVVSLQRHKLTGMLSWPEFLLLAPSVVDKRFRDLVGNVQAEDVVNIQYTSGTTGFPKGAMLTHRNLLMNAFYIGQRMAFTEQDRLCLPVPFYHCFGCVMGNLTCAIYGAALVVPAEAFDPLTTLQTIQDERCTAVYGVPTMFIAELAHPQFGEFSLPSLRTGIMAGSPCPIEIMRAVVERMGARDMTIAYGLTEASPVITQTQPSDSLDCRVGTVGKALPGLEVKIVKPGATEAVPCGEAGELMVRGHGVMKGYYNKPAETAQMITDDGWMHSGDLAAVNSDGYYRITGRIKDMIIRGGENVYPREIEEYLYAHPEIADVQVVGLPDVKFGEEISAWIRRKPGSNLNEEGVKQFCKDKIAYFKIPRYVIFVDQFPTTVTGKIQKFKLREQGIERFGLEQAARIETA
jgi:fatty-acyl-CoA synthase